MLRIAAIGAVDDGKSTLIGRLLHDAGGLTEDQVRGLQGASAPGHRDGLNLSFVTDGLRAERQQGITIDVAYRYALTPNHKLVLADCPGHLEYTRNTATGASTADRALVVVDATRGLREQTRRHLAIAMVLGVRDLVVAVNKMDLVAWDRDVYTRLAAEIGQLAEGMGGASLIAVPVSAARGDQVVRRTSAAPWYGGPTLLEALDRAATDPKTSGTGPRLPVQMVAVGPDGYFCVGRLSGGTLRRDDEVVILPGGSHSRVLALDGPSGPIEVARPGMSLRVRLAGCPAVTRGDVIAHPGSAPRLWSTALTTVCWLTGPPARAGSQFQIKHLTLTSRAEVLSVAAVLDMNSLRMVPAAEVAANSIGLVRWRFDRPLAADPYAHSRATGAFIALAPGTRTTVGAGMISAFQ